jgi:hypothetical protein
LGAILERDRDDSASADDGRSSHHTQSNGAEMNNAFNQESESLQEEKRNLIIGREDNRFGYFIDAHRTKKPFNFYGDCIFLHLQYPQPLFSAICNMHDLLTMA